MTVGKNLSLPLLDTSQSTTNKTGNDEKKKIEWDDYEYLIEQCSLEAEASVFFKRSLLSSECIESLAAEALIEAAGLFNKHINLVIMDNFDQFARGYIGKHIRDELLAQQEIPVMPELWAKTLPCDSSSDPAEIFEKKMDYPIFLEKVKQELKNLSEVEKRIFLLRFKKQMGFSEIAQDIGESLTDTFKIFLGAKRFIKQRVGENA